MGKVAFTAPHYAVSEIGLTLLQNGANAVDAMVAAAAAISVAYPHMNSIAGDGFWVIQKPGEKPVAINASGYAAAFADITHFQKKGLSAVPSRGLDACVTLGGTVSGWQVARDYIANTGETLSELEMLLAPAIQLAESGVEVTESLEAASKKLCDELAGSKRRDEYAGFFDLFTHDGKPLKQGEQVVNQALANSFKLLSKHGLNDFYNGELASKLAAGFASLGGEINTGDLEHYQATRVEPLRTEISKGTLYNLPAPTQGLASMLILKIYDALYQAEFTELDRVHYLVEATKEAFRIRDTFITDRNALAHDEHLFFSDEYLQEFVANISAHAQPWPHIAKQGDTVWMGCVDGNGTMVSFIQSVYWEFGSAVVLPDTGIVWNNRGSSFSLDDTHHNGLKPGKQPFHTLNPAFAELADGTRMVYGTMGGEGQPQTQAALFTRYLYDNQSLQSSIADARWLLGRTWGASDTDLKIEHDLYTRIGEGLIGRGHQIKSMPNLSEAMGHAGAIALKASGELDCATDPRSDGAALIFE